MVVMSFMVLVFSVFVTTAFMGEEKAKALSGTGKALLLILSVGLGGWAGYDLHQLLVG